ncbi:hypothetical protein ACFWYW_05565 [Nonomuraea sp. NPDC059023]|uniref:hypothetical protein n=1 Tax=unclassified Nonomuraea TaxID=2593643 RepID=UPI003696826F
MSSHDIVIDVDGPYPAGHARRWLSEVPAALAPGLRSGVVCVDTDARGFEYRPLTVASVDWLLAVAAGEFNDAWVELCDGDGHDDALIVGVERFSDRLAHTQLRAWSFLRAPEYGLAAPGVAERWAGVLRDFAAPVDPAFGHVADDSMGQGMTALDGAVVRGGRIPSARQARRFLRGYSWITICPAELAGRVDTAAFHEAEKLPGGALWLRATRELAGYDEVAVRRVFEALAPVLPPGRPSRDPFDTRTRRLVWEDAGRR